MQILERVGVDYVVQNMPAMHRDHRCLSTGSAQLLYIKEASSGHTHYGLHLYRLRSSKKSDDHNQLQHHHRLRSAERAGCDSRLSDRASVTLDRPKQHKLDGKMESALPPSADDSNSRTLERTSHRPCSANENPVQQLHEQQQQPHTGTVWLGICGRGIDIYEVRNIMMIIIITTFHFITIGLFFFPFVIEFFVPGGGQLHEDGPRYLPVAQHRQTLFRGKGKKIKTTKKSFL